MNASITAQILHVGVLTQFMDTAEFAGKIDHTTLGQTTTWRDVELVLDAALVHGMQACIPPCFVESAIEYTPNVPVVSVCGFPHGNETIDSKVFQAETLWKVGATEVDVVINVGKLLENDTTYLEKELHQVEAAVPIPVKIIVEAPLLSERQLRTICELAKDANVAYLKTATGFAEGGATVSDVEIMADHLPVKASGGISSVDDAIAMLEAGADRIGSSAGNTLVEAFDSNEVQD